MKRLLGIGLVTALMGASIAQAAYVDAISLNLSGGSGSLVSGTQAGAAGTMFGSWINMTGGHAANWAASADGSGWTSGSMDGTLSAQGVALGSFRIDLYDGGWGLNSQWNDTANANNTPGRSGISNGDMPSGWGPTGLGMDLNNIPVAFQTSGYEIWALGGATKNSGAELSWAKISGATPLIGADPANVTLNSMGWRSVAAIQVLQIGEVPEPGTVVLLGSLLGLGAIGGLRRRFFGAKKSVVA